MKAPVLQRKCYLLDKQQAGWRHAILKFILISSIIKALSSLGGDFFFLKRPVARGTADFRGEINRHCCEFSAVPPASPRHILG
jgi:hypothetical protein